MKARSGAPFTPYPGRLVSAVPRRITVRACMTSAIASQFRLCCTGTATEKTSGGAYQSCPLSRSRTCHRHLLVRDGHAGTDGGRRRAAGETLGGSRMKDSTSFPTLLESFFLNRLIAQRRASPHTI